jgi:putative peptide zinc metalloprotease protein
MGAGFYMAYPAFYTDVTDNYRLSRWSRVRTDLGGFYFHLLFALGVMAVYVATGWEVLLLVVLLINFEIIHQLMPFVRLDGYWTLADLIGIPDFFSHIGPFLRTVLPLGFWKGPKLPELKTWAKLVFLLYILVTIPLLLFMLVMLIAGLPRVLATAWDSFWQQWAGLHASLSRGDALTIISSAVQMLVLALMTFGLLYFLFSLARSLGQRLWAWSRPSWPRRMAGAGVTVAVIALLALLFLPTTPFTGGRGPLGGSVRFEPLRPGEPLTLTDMSRVAAAVVAPGLVSPPPAASSGSPMPTGTSPSVRPTPGAGQSPTPQPTTGATASPTPTPTPSPSSTPTPTPTPSPTP